MGAFAGQVADRLSGDAARGTPARRVPRPRPVAHRIEAEPGLEAEEDARLAGLARGGDKDARDALVERLASTVQTAVAFRLARTNLARSMMEDLFQETWVQLFRNGARRLAEWDPAKSTLRYFVSLLAQQVVCAALRTRKVNPDLRDDVYDEELLEGIPSEEDLERFEQIKDFAWKLEEMVYAESTAEDLRRYRRLFREESTPGELAAEEGTTANAISIWKSRFKQRLHAWARRLDKEEL